MAELATQTQLVLARKANPTMSADCWATLALLIALVPIMRAVGLPLKFAWADYFVSFWVALTLQSIFAACVLYVVGSPYAETLGLVIRRIRKQKARLLFLIPLVVLLIYLHGPLLGFLVFVDTIALLEFLDRSTEGGASAAKMLLDVFIPAAYLFVVLILVFAYNDIIALLRYDGSWEYAMNRADAFILSGHTVSPWAHAVLSRWPQSVPWLQVIYFAMFMQIGAAIAILALRNGRSIALKFVGTIAFAYYASLFIFYWMPTTGPYAICRDHFSFFPAGTSMYETQQALLGSLSQLRLSHTLNMIGKDYFIGFPSMHIVQPLIVLWFFRARKGLLILLIAFDILLVPAILLLEEHYLVDLIAAIPVAALAIAICGRQTAIGGVQNGRATVPAEGP
ncbi:MAG TPA: phosphatase PAP2 family protein [Candidatus Acidoferrales bacterium]|nr:phosphatase PAP2 family protein [Candidatus Acidoferrales bacterium]